MSVHKRNIAELVDSMAELLAAPPPPPKRSIGLITHEDNPSRPKANSKTPSQGIKARTKKP